MVYLNFIVLTIVRHVKTEMNVFIHVAFGANIGKKITKPLITIILFLGDFCFNAHTAFVKLGKQVSLNKLFYLLFPDN